VGGRDGRRCESTGKRAAHEVQARVHLDSRIIGSYRIAHRLAPRIETQHASIVGSQHTRNACRATLKCAGTVKMDSIFAEFHFTDPKIKTAAALFIDKYRMAPRSLGHTVGMAVHDVGSFPVLTPGMVFALEPDLTIPDERLSVRIENVYLVTDTKVENLSPEAPVDIDGIERVMRGEGIAEQAGAKIAQP